LALKTQRRLATKQTLAYVMALFTILLWSSAFAASRYALKYYKPESLMTLRFVVASTVLTIVGFIKKIRLPERQDLPMFVLGGFIGIFLYMFCFNTGSVYVVAGISSFIIASAPVFTIILSRLLLKEVVKPACWIGVAISFCGLMLIMISQNSEFSLNAGVFLLLGSAIATSIHNIIQRGLLKTYTALEATTYTILFATVFMLMFLPGAIRELPGSTFAVNMVVVYLGVFPAAAAYLSWGFALSKAEKTTHVTVFLYLIPFIASLLAFLWLRETFSFKSFFGGAVIIAGMLITNTSAARNT
jgi:drug/metabolite transporter (DMT)-like permease